VRQTAAIIAHGNRKPSLSGITAPTLVIHGSEDPLVPVEAAKDTTESIPGAELLIIDGMGHDLPREVWPQLVDAIAAHTQKAAKA
jgi:pimeloyl-ACP methyl ester carboxylesterase